MFGLPIAPPPAASQSVESPPVVQRPEEHMDYDLDLEAIENYQPAGTSTPRLYQRNPKKRKAEDFSDLLLQQTEYLKQITANSDACAKYARKMFHLEEDKFKFKKEYLLREEKRKVRELEYQVAMLEYKKRKLDLLEAKNSK